MKKKLETYGKIKNHKSMFASILIISLIIIFVIVITIIRPSIFKTNDASPNLQKEITKKQEFVNNINYFENENIIKNLPSSAIISLNIGEKYYTITKGKIIEEKTSNSDIKISIPEKYSIEINKDFCSFIKKVNTNKDLSISLEISKTELLWKYRSVIKYKDCLGL